MPKLQQVLAKNQVNYLPNAWQHYTSGELSQWVSLFAKRATHRNDKTKALKDIEDSQNYLIFLKEKLINEFS